MQPSRPRPIVRRTPSEPRRDETAAVEDEAPRGRPRSTRATSSVAARRIPAEPNETTLFSTGSVDHRAMLDRAKSRLENITFFRPIIQRAVPDQLAHGVIHQRVIPLLARIAKAQGEMRGERAQEMRERTQNLLADLKMLELSDLNTAERLFDRVNAISKGLEVILDDANYISFGQVGLLHQLRAANVALRSSQALWHSIRLADAMREPALRHQTLDVALRAERVCVRAERSEDVTQELEELEHRYGVLSEALEHRLNADPGLDGGATAIRTSRTVWRYRNAIEQAALAREQRIGERMTNAELLRWVRKNGVPSEVVAQILEEDIVKALRAYAEAEGTNRSEIARATAQRASALADRIGRLGPEELHDVDRLEATTQDIGREIDAILRDAEAVADPVSAPIRKLRSANDAIRAFRGVFTAMRLTDAVEDPTFRGKALHLVDQIQLLAQNPEKSTLDGRLGEIEALLSAFGRELEGRLKIEHSPGIDTGVRTIKAARKIVRLRKAGEAALNEEVRAAFRAVSDLEMTPRDRLAIYKVASGQPLLDAVVGLLSAAREVELGFTFAEVGHAVNNVLHAGGDGDVTPLLAKSPFAFLARADFEHALGRMDRFLDKVDTPEGQAHISGSLNVIRAAGRAERDNVGRVAVRIPETERLNVATGLADYTANLTMLLLQWLGSTLAEPGGEAIADFLEAAITTSELQLDELLGEDPRTLSTDEVEEIWSSIRTGARTDAAGMAKSRLPTAARVVASRGFDQDYIRRLVALNAKLADCLKVAETTPDSRDALRAIFADLTQSVRMMVNLIQLFGAATNENMDEDERGKAIQGSVERMGPLFVKIMQTLANMQGLFHHFSPELSRERADPIFDALKKLQDEVTPLPWPVIKKEIESSLGCAAEDAFVWIDENPLKSGSIGQTHRAKIQVGHGRDREEIDVVIKVLRPGIDDDFKDAIRVTRITLSVFQELLRLDTDAAIFGKTKAEAQRKLPMIERALEGFIESFRVETNFQQEAANMKRFGNLLGPDRHVAVPLVYDSHTKGNVITMQELKGFKLSRWLERYELSKAAEPIAELRGPLSREHAGADAEQRAAQWLTEVFDIVPTKTSVARRSHGWFEVKVGYSSDDRNEQEQRVFVREKDGQIQPKGRLPKLPRKATEARVHKWAEHAFGLPVKAVRATQAEPRALHFFDKGGFSVEIEFDDPRQKSAEAYVRQSDGRIEPRGTVPDLSAQAMAALRDRLGSTFVSQILRGFVHGDPHQGNFFILADGKTIAFMDFGLAIKLRIHDAAGPLLLLAGALLQEPKKMAEAMVGMSNLPTTASKKERAELVGQLTDQFRKLCEEVQHAAVEEEAKLDLDSMSWLKRLQTKALGAFQRTRAVLERSVDVVLNRVGLAPSTLYLQALKSTLSMGGNIAAFEALSLDTSRVKQAVKVLGSYLLHQALGPIFGGRMQAKKARHIDRISVMDVVGSRSTPRTSPAEPKRGVSLPSAAGRPARELHQVWDGRRMDDRPGVLGPRREA